MKSSNKLKPHNYKTQFQGGDNDQFHVTETAVLNTDVPLKNPDPDYSVSLLNGPAGTSDLFINGLNNLGQTVGTYIVGPDTDYGFIYHNGTFTSLSGPSGSIGALLFGINDSGEAVGEYGVRDASSGGTLVQGFFYNAGVYTTFALPAGSTAFVPTDINNTGEVVGAYETGTPQDQVSTAFIYDAGVYTTLTGPSGTSLVLPSSVNDSGVVAGDLDMGDQHYGFIYKNGGYTILKGPPGSGNTEASGISNAGVVAFDTENGGFLYHNGVYTPVMVPLSEGGTTPGVVEGISDSGEVVGSYADGDTTRTFIYNNGVYSSFAALPGTSTLLSGDINDSGQVVGDVIYNGSDTGFIANPVCYVQGTCIATASGPVSVQDLRIGDLIKTPSGAARLVTWIGHKTLPGSFLVDHPEANPVRILPGAFGNNLPTRILRLSPGHPVLVGADEDGEGGVLVPIMCLINGTSIARDSVDSVTYWHVELDQHDIILAEGLPAESFLDYGNRAWFENHADHALTNPDFIPPGLNARCRPVAIDGPLVEAERRRIDMVFAARLSAECHWPAPEMDMMAFLA